MIFVAVYYPGLIIREENLPFGISLIARSSVGTCQIEWVGPLPFPAVRLSEMFLLVVPLNVTH